MTKHLTEEREERQRTVGAKSTNKTGRPNKKKNTERGRQRHPLMEDRTNPGKRGRKGEEPGHRAKKQKQETADQSLTNNRSRTRRYKGKEMGFGTTGDPLTKVKP